MHQNEIYYTQNDLRSDPGEYATKLRALRVFHSRCVMTCSKIAVDAAHSPILTTAGDRSDDAAPMSPRITPTALGFWLFV